MFETELLAYTLSQAARQLATKIDEIHNSVIRMEEFLHKLAQTSEEVLKSKHRQESIAKELSEVKKQLATDVEGTIFRFQSPLTIHYRDMTFSVHEFIDPLVLDVMDLFVEENQASVSMVQRRFRIGYSRAARIVDYLESQGMISKCSGSKPRELLITKRDWDIIKQAILQEAQPHSLPNVPVMRENDNPSQ